MFAHVWLQAGQATEEDQIDACLKLAAEVFFFGKRTAEHDVLVGQVEGVA